MIGNVTRVNGSLRKRTVINDYLLLIFGFIGAVTREPYSQAALFCSYGSHFIVVSGLWEMYTQAIDGATDCKLDKNSLYMARAATAVAWNTCILSFH